MKRLNKTIKEKANALNQWILEQDVIKEYKKYEMIIQNHEELKTLEENLKKQQQKIVQLKHQGLLCDKEIYEYETKKKMFNENPIVANYLALKQEVNELLSYIQDDINEQLKKKVD